MVCLQNGDRIVAIDSVTSLHPMYTCIYEAIKRVLTNQMQGKPVCSPTGCSPSRMLITVNWSVIWFACVQRSTCTSCRAPPDAECHAKTNKNWLPRQRPLKLRDGKSNFRSTAEVLPTVQIW